MEYNLNGPGGAMVQGGSYVASSPSVDMDIGKALGKLCFPEKACFSFGCQDKASLS